MIRNDLYSIVAKRLNIPCYIARQAVDATIDSLIDALAQGERIEMRGFGVFEVVPRKTGIGRNPKTGEVVPLVPGKRIRFKPGKVLKN